MQAAKVPVPPPIAHANFNPQSQALQHEKSGYVTSARTQMDQMQQQVASMQATTWRTAGPNRAAFDKLLRDVAVKRAALQADIASIPNAPAESWPALKAKADRDLVAFRATVGAASGVVEAVTPIGMPPSFDVLDCVARAVSAIHFRATQSGFAFTTTIEFTDTR